MDCSPLGSSVHRIFQARILEWVTIILLQGIFPTQELNPHLVWLLHCRQILYPLSCQGSPKMKFVIVVVLIARSCPTLFDPMNWSPPGSSVHRFSRQEYWRGLPFPTQGDLPAQMIRAMSPIPPVLQVDSLPLSHGGKCDHKYQQLQTRLHRD